MIKKSIFKTDSYAEKKWQKRLLHLSDNDIDIAISANEMKEVRNDEQ